MVSVGHERIHSIHSSSRERLRVPLTLSRRRLQLGLLILAAALVIGSIFLPYWDITLHAPQYPQGLQVEAYPSHLAGRVHEVDGLNHYIGMMKLNDAAAIERSLSLFAIPLVAILALAAYWIPGRWKWAFIAPLIAFPFIFIADLGAWLYYAGHSLDPHAPLSSAIKPFMPHLLGTGQIGQFSTEATFGIGFYLAILGVVLAVAATLIARRGSDVPN